MFVEEETFFYTYDDEERDRTSDGGMYVCMMGLEPFGFREGFGKWDQTSSI